MSDESDRTESPQPDDPEAESRWITWRSAAAPRVPGAAAAPGATPAPVVSRGAVRPWGAAPLGRRGCCRWWRAVCCCWCVCCSAATAPPPGGGAAVSVLDC